MCVLKVANQEDYGVTKIEERDIERTETSEIDQWLHLLETEDPQDSKTSIFSGLGRELEMSAIVSALTHVVSGNIPGEEGKAVLAVAEAGGGGGGGGGGETSSTSSGQKRGREEKEEEKGEGRGGRAAVAAKAAAAGSSVGRYFSGGGSGGSCIRGQLASC